MAHYRASESKREQFRRYLEKAGILDSLTCALVALYEEQEKPSNAMEFLKQYLCVTDKMSTDTEALQRELSELTQRCALLVEENKELKTRLQRYEPGPEDGGTAN
ncbi:c-Myc-binding protein-like [Myripristis murdjan]|uniref:MYC binding protein n=1 Tax=Myripristis murdjan TaxID=586833 RepID=A0A667ZI62_9TELE|nr:c-Myc-binding protein-like [Myripristis murdjan]